MFPRSRSLLPQPSPPLLIRPFPLSSLTSLPPPSFVQPNPSHSSTATFNSPVINGERERERERERGREGGGGGGQQFSPVFQISPTSHPFSFFFPSLWCRGTIFPRARGYACIVAQGERERERLHDVEGEREREESCSRMESRLVKHQSWRNENFTLGIWYAEWCPPIACEILSHFLFFSFSKSSVLLLLVLVLSKNSSIRRKLFIVESKSIGKDSSRDLINFFRV